MGGLGHLKSKGSVVQSGGVVEKTDGSVGSLDVDASVIGATVVVWTARATVVVGPVVAITGGLVTTLICDSSPTQLRCWQEPSQMSTLQVK